MSSRLKKNGTIIPLHKPSDIKIQTPHKADIKAEVGTSRNGVTDIKIGKNYSTQNTGRIEISLPNKGSNIQTQFNSNLHKKGPIAITI